MKNPAEIKKEMKKERVEQIKETIDFYEYQIKTFQLKLRELVMKQNNINK